MWGSLLPWACERDRAWLRAVGDGHRRRAVNPPASTVPAYPSCVRCSRPIKSRADGIPSQLSVCSRCEQAEAEEDEKRETARIKYQARREAGVTPRRGRRAAAVADGGFTSW